MTSSLSNSNNSDAPLNESEFFENPNRLQKFEISDIQNSDEIDIDKTVTIHRRSTKISINEYFKQDLNRSDTFLWLEKRQSQILTQYLGLGEAFSDFNFNGFFSTFIYHLLYFCVLGPFVNPIICLFHSINFARNMEFLSLSPYSIMQFWLFLSTTTSLIIFIGIAQDEISFAAAIGFVCSVIFRCSVIGLKYSFINKEKLNFMTRHYIPLTIRTKDHIIPNWTNQFPENVYKELRESIKRHEIDDSLFYFSFYVDEITEHRPNFLESNNFINQKLKEDNIISYYVAEKKSQYTKGKYHGLSLVYDFIQGHNKNTKYKQILVYTLSIFLSGVLFFAPYLIEVDQNLKPRVIFRFAQLNSYEIIGFWTSLFPAMFFSTFDFYFLFVLLTDVERLSVVMKDLTKMLKTKGVHFTSQNSCSNPQLVNFLDFMSLKTWSYMRRVVIDYGINYRKRVEYATATFTIFNFVIAVYFVFSFLFDQQPLYPLASILILIRLVIFLVILSVNFIICAGINNSYLSQKAACQEIKNTISFIRKFNSYFLDEKTKVDSHAILAKKIQSEYEKYLKICPNKSLEEYMEELEETLKDVMYEIDFDISHNSFKVVGVKAEMNLYKKIVLTIISFILSSIVKFLIYNKSI